MTQSAATQPSRYLPDGRPFHLVVTRTAKGRPVISAPVCTGAGCSHCTTPQAG